MATVRTVSGAGLAAWTVTVTAYDRGGTQPHAGADRGALARTATVPTGAFSQREVEGAVHAS